ncbi:VOC family protein [Kaarinaea lacus]
MIAKIVPQFFTSNLENTLRYYDSSLGFVTQFTYGEPAYYAGAIRDGQSIFFRHVDPCIDKLEEKYSEEYLDAYIRVEDIEMMYEEYDTRQVDFHRRIDTMPWGFREFVVKDCDGRLLCFGQDVNSVEQGV